MLLPIPARSYAQVCVVLPSVGWTASQSRVPALKPASSTTVGLPEPTQSRNRLRPPPMVTRRLVSRTPLSAGVGVGFATSLPSACSPPPQPPSQTDTSRIASSRRLTGRVSQAPAERTPHPAATF